MPTPAVAIVGAGPGGLASAMLLAAAGCDVTVLERDRRPGGRTSMLESDGFRFDRGPTFFLYPEILQGIFRMCGRELRDEVDLRRLEPNYRLIFGDGGSLDASSDLERLKAAVRRISPGDAANVDAYVRENRRKFAAFRPFLESPFDSHLDLLKLPLRELLPLARPWASVDSDLGRFFTDPRIRLAFSFQSKYLGMSPFKCPSLFTILAFLEYEFGVFHPIGGCAAVTRAMHRVASDMGVRFRFDEPAEEILFEGRRARAVRTRGGEYACDALVVNADFAGAMRDLVPDRLRSRWTDKRIAKKNMSCSTYMLYLGIDGRCEDLAHHTILLAEDYAQNLRDTEELHRLPANPSLYVHNPSLLDPTLAPRDASSLYVLVPVTHEHPNVDWKVAEPMFRERVLDTLERRLDLGDLRRRIRTQMICTPADWASGMHLYKGATFSLAHTLDQMLSFRPHNRFEDLEGVYLVGGGTHPGSGLPVIFQSAKISTQLIAEDFGLRDAWRPPTTGSTPRWPAFASEGA
jgi:phytoene desaturase